jgi:hypothetical protein
MLGEIFQQRIGNFLPTHSDILEISLQREVFPAELETSQNSNKKQTFKGDASQYLHPADFNTDQITSYTQLYARRTE